MVSNLITGISLPELYPSAKSNCFAFAGSYSYPDRSSPGPGDFFIDTKLKIDDPVGAVAVHGVNGFWGVLSLGLFADGSYGDGWNGVPGPVKGLFYGDSGQFFAELIGGITCFVFVFPVMYFFFKICKKTIGLRSSDADQVAGLDIPEMGVNGYVD